jgi:hypothetical protein
MSGSCVQGGQVTPQGPTLPGLAGIQLPQAARSVVQDQGPTAHHRGEGHQDCNVHQLRAAASPVPSMPKVIVNGSNFVRQVVIRLPNPASTSTRIKPCHAISPTRRRTGRNIQEARRRVHKGTVACCQSFRLAVAREPHTGNFHPTSFGRSNLWPGSPDQTLTSPQACGQAPTHPPRAWPFSFRSR